MPVQSNGDMGIEQPGTGLASRHTAYHCGMGGCPAVIRIQHGAAMPRATFYGHQRRQHPGQGPEFLLHIQIQLTCHPAFTTPPTGAAHFRACSRCHNLVSQNRCTQGACKGQPPQTEWIVSQQPPQLPDTTTNTVPGTRLNNDISGGA